MHNIIRRSATRFNILCHHWQQFWWLFHRYARIADLERLIAWARRKRLSGPRNYYQYLLETEHTHLMRYTIREPQLSRWARVVYEVSTVLNPPPRYRARGSAARYRRANLTI